MGKIFWVITVIIGIACVRAYCKNNVEKFTETEHRPASVCVWVAVLPSALDCMNMTISYNAPDGQEKSVEVKKSDLCAVPSGSMLENTVNGLFLNANNKEVKKEDLMAFCIHMDSFTEWNTDVTAHLTCKKQMPAGVKSWGWVQTAAFEVIDGALSDSSTFAGPVDMTVSRRANASDVNSFLSYKHDMKLASINLSSAR